MSKKEKDISSVTISDNQLDQSYWEAKWQSQQTGWDIGQASPAISSYMANYPNKNASILIPGCGNAYEAEFLLANGFINITLIDIAPKAAGLLKEKFAKSPQVKVLCEDFFQHQGKYDLIIEQTFFCAIQPKRRKEYAEKAFSLLNREGKIIGLLFDRSFDHQGPPFGGCAEDYKPIFRDYFKIETMEESYNSITARAGSEVFIKLLRK